MTLTSPDLPRPNRRGFSRVSCDVAHNHRDAAKTSSRRRTAPSTPIARLQSVRCHRSNHARPRLHAPMLARLVRAGLATAQSETGKAIAVGRIRITDAGRRWLEDAAKSELRGPNRFKDFWR
jgi:hypothetical protein